jgi:hypothetical protein
MATAAHLERFLRRLEAAQAGVETMVVPLADAVVEAEATLTVLVAVVAAWALLVLVALVGLPVGLELLEVEVAVAEA